ncbi:MAG: DegT/DnrJ/EryC1/StrS family aminotransferase, partial [Elusimicrobiota bacterium]|nr:DegT/DnrJ/EryC1/StrS family aminotransferase [Endomicrobiia bacterium]MDW8166663.1 DegT/DnrJ/EryC1/StrS family aminotransferase [Elusimicrobiota bacterium]
MMRKRRIFVGDFLIGKEERKAIIEVMDAGIISESKKTREFEKLWSGYIGTKYCVAVNSGTSALILGWNALKIYKNIGSKRRKVITSPVTYIATSNSLVLSGFEPVYVDIDPQKFVITPDNIENHLKSINNVDEYIAINPVHLMGYCADMNRINKIAEKYDLVVVEDSAQAHGSIYDGRKAGSMSLFSIFSFYIAHNIQAGELGALNTNDEKIFYLAKKLKANGRFCTCFVCVRKTGKCPKKDMSGNNDPRFLHDLIGYNFKTMEFQTALAVTQIKKVDEICQKRKSNVKYLNEKLNKFSNILQLPLFDENVSYLAYPIVVKDEKIITREKLCEELEKYGIETRPLFGCIPTQQPSFSHLKNLYRDKLPVADYIGRNGFYIGCHQYLSK